MTDAMTWVVFAGLAAVTLGGAFGMLFSRSVVHAAFWLLAVSIAAAGLFALLSANYVALIQLLVYAGAVAILNIFTIMITLRRREDAVRSRDVSSSALLLAFGFFLLVAIAIFGGSIGEAEQLADYPGVAEFGALLFSVDGWALPFEIASLVLTAALVAAVWWSKEDER
jgi:NADH-quinone oxidoreductase subunit J